MNKAGAKSGARPAQGTATTTGEGLVRTHERTSLQSGEAQDKQSSSKEQGKLENVGEGADNSVKEAVVQQRPTERCGNVAADYVEEPQEHSGEMRPLKSANDDKLSITSLPPSTTIPVTKIDGESSVSVQDAIRAIDHLPGSVDTLDGYHLNISRTTRNKLKNEISKHKNDIAVLTAMSHIEEIVGKSLLIEEHRDRMKIDGERKSDNPSDQNIEKTQRFYGAATIDGVPYRVKSTAIVSRNTDRTRMHNYEITKIELLSPIASTRQKAYTAVDNNSITLAKLLQNVEFSYEKGRKILDEMQNNADASDNDILYRVEDDPEELKKLEMEPKVKVYRAMQLIDGKLYPPMAAKVHGKYVEPAVPGQWLRADEHPELAKNGLFTLNKGGKDASGKRLGSVPAAYNPYWHTSRSPLNDQFSSAYKRPNLVTVEVEIPKSELTSGYHADGAKDPVGEMSWHAGPVSSKLPKEKERKVILSRWCKVVRVVPDAEVADKVAGMLKGENISVPDNTVTPSLRRELEKRGVPITHTKMVEDWERKYPSGKEDYAREGDGAYTDDELSMINDPFVKMLGEKARSAKQRKAFAARERRNMADAVRELAERLHLDNVEIRHRKDYDGAEDARPARAKGYYSRKSGKIVVNIDNQRDVQDAVQTLLHEAVAHYGLRQLFGEHFDTFLRNVYEAADMDVRRRITELALRKYGGDFRVATEEYLASLAEQTDFENMPHGFWQKIKRMFLAMLHAIGFDGFADKGVTLSDNELRYILWRSYENLKEPGEHRSILGEAEDVAKQVELKVGNYGDTAAEEQRAERSINGQQEVAEGDGVAEEDPSGAAVRASVAEKLDARAEEIRNMPAIPIKKHDTSREYVREKYNSLGTAINKRDGKKVTFYHGVFGKMWRGENSLFAKIAPQLKDLFESSIYGFSSEDLLAGKKRPDGTIHKVHRNIDNYDYYVGKALINGKDYYVRFTVQNSEMKGNSGVHDVMVTDVSIYENSTGDASTSRRITGERLVANGTISDAKLMHLFGLDVNNSEKDADASENVSKPKVGARPAQGTATTTDEGSLQSGAGTDGDGSRQGPVNGMAIPEDKRRILSEKEIDSVVDDLEEHASEQTVVPYSKEEWNLNSATKCIVCC